MTDTETKLQKGAEAIAYPLNRSRRARDHGRPIRPLHPSRSGEFPITPTVNENGSGTNSETPEKNLPKLP